MSYRQLVDWENDLQHQSDIEELALKREPRVKQLITDFNTFYLKKYGIALSAIEDAALKPAFLKHIPHITLNIINLTSS